MWLDVQPGQDHADLYPTVVAHVRSLGQHCPLPDHPALGPTRLPLTQPFRVFLVKLYLLTHELDGTRPVISNDGWEHALSDLCTITTMRRLRTCHAATEAWTQRWLAVAAPIRCTCPVTRTGASRSW